ncbi:helix-turn-helix transcriptional regulator [Enterococcus casseliflavus]
MIDVKNIYHTDLVEYCQEYHCETGWALVVTKDGYHMDQARVEILLINCRHIEKYVLENNFKQLIVADLNLFSKCCMDFITKIELKINKELETLIQLLFTRFESTDRTYVIDHAVDLILRKCFRKNAKKLNEYFEVFKLIDFIQLNLNTNLSVVDLANYMHMSKATLNRFCFKKLEKSPKQLIKDIKAAEIKTFLESTDKSICDIAEITGFPQANSLAIFFKRETGYSPIEYREEYYNLLKSS